MSSAAVATRGAAHAAQATSGTAHAGWLESLKDEAVRFVKGDSNAPWAILAETVIGCVPVLGQIVDARDVIKGLVEVAGAPACPLAWFNLITALIGLIPGGGDAVKRSTRAIKSGAVRVDELLDMIRRYYKGDPEKLLREALDLAKLRKQLDNILGNPNFTRQLSPEMRQRVDDIRANLSHQFDAFKKEIDGWLAKGRKTSADTGPAAKLQPGTPPAKPGTQANAGTQGSGEHNNPCSPNTPNAATQRTARFKSLTQKVLGVMGEHMADYYCQDVKGWGQAVRHDQALVNEAKLNDHGRLVQLWPTLPRGRGIDAIWHSKGAKPYAIIEAKASYDPTKSLAALLGEAGDKNERGGSNAGSGSGRGGGAGRRGGGRSGSSSVRQSNGKRTQMSKGWIESRLQRATSSSIEAQVISSGYTRHVLFFSIPQATAHAEALILHASGRLPADGIHSAHQATREFGDNQISKIVNDRAAVVDAHRRAR
ncbi:hypothetical protein CKO44_10485 [Rubrivivax gelatinosus]|uniref:Uncharacterized protein n=1 Tax=Rubrivivax gelatinosus TaxID=28068 RepID=A0ABS1DX32_RUBGE|nr:hypothetical protein [Rubrivivax gelatinosus]MBK1613896.1 hypothetical protein [Rubrivivax gelatinosus]MBK1714341.1 hypothetical protein [Rubrivivax gelatinosus]